MKYLLFIALLFTACNKNSDNNGSKCYVCETTGFSGTGSPAPYMKRDICTDRVDTVTFKDSNGNDLQHVCTLK